MKTVSYIPYKLLKKCFTYKTKAAMMQNVQKRNRADQKMNLFTTLTDFWNYDSRNLISQNDSFFEQLYAHYQLRTEVPPKIQRSIWELILMHLPSTKMLAQYWVEVLSTALNSLVAGLTSLKIWSTKSAKKRHLCASISAHSLHCKPPVPLVGQKTCTWNIDMAGDYWKRLKLPFQ